MRCNPGSKDRRNVETTNDQEIKHMKTLFALCAVGTMLGFTACDEEEDHDHHHHHAVTTTTEETTTVRQAAPATTTTVRTY